MKAFVTGVGGQLGHDVMDELAKRGYEGVGSDILESVITDYPYVQLDITDADAVEKATEVQRADKKSVENAINKKGFDSKIFVQKICKLYEEDCAENKLR